MNAGLFGFHFFGCRDEALQKVTKTDNVDQFVHPNVENEREQFKVGIPLQGGEDGMVLEANFVKIVRPRAETGAQPLALIADYLGKGALHRLFGG